jgi:uncharacterized membrane protein HdeD (DUF308 family)
MNVIVNHLANVLSRHWWVLLLRGLVAIVFGIMTWTQPGISLAALILLFGVYTLADGVLGVWTGITGRGQHRWMLLLWGILGIGVGLLTFVVPGITALLLLLYIAAWAIATGLLEVVLAIRLRKEIKGEFFLVLGGLVSIGFGLFVAARPGVGALAVLKLIAVYAIAFGVILTALAFKVKGLAARVATA